MNNRNLILLGAAATALVTFGLLFFLNVFHIQQALGFPPTEEQLMEAIESASKQGGISAAFSDGEVKKWQIPDGHQLERFGLNDQGMVFARLRSDGPINNDLPEWALRGLSLKLPTALNQAAQGKEIEIGVVARSAQSSPSPEMAAVYATQQAGNSGWQSFKLTSYFDLHKFTYKVPVPDTGYDRAPILVFHPDVEGKKRSVEILGVYIKILPNK
jgi:hypothetical protein